MTTNSDGNEILRYIKKHGIQNKDINKQVKRPKRKAVQKKKAEKNRRVVDLHGRTCDEAAVIMHSAFESCKRSGITSLLIIHGKGYSSDPEEGPVLKKLVHTMLNNQLRSYVRDYGFALPKDGGDGATLVTIK
jgi:DNA-nicking Smr family endonuclease